MLKIFGREALLILLCGVFVHYIATQWHAEATGLFWVGMFMGMTYMALYAIVVLSSSRMGTLVRAVIGGAAFGVAFLIDPVLEGLGLSLLIFAIPAVMALLLAGLGAASARFFSRVESAVDGFFAYSLGMAGVRWLLLPMLGASPEGRALALFTGVFYMTLRVAIRLLWPSAPEGDLGAGPLVHRPVPDPIVGLMEGVSNRQARPYATLPDGSKNGLAISVLCRLDEVDPLVAELADRLAGAPFAVSTGVETDGKIEVVIQPVKAIAPTERS
jgi:hypothetical protein